MTRPDVSGIPTIQPLTAGPHLRPARLAEPMMTGAMINFKTRISIDVHLICRRWVCQLTENTRARCPCACVYDYRNAPLNIMARGSRPYARRFAHVVGYLCKA